VFTVGVTGYYPGVTFFSPHQIFVYPLPKHQKMSSPHIPPPKSHRVEADTIKKTRFFHAFDHRDKKFIQIICKAENISYDTSKY
jgi:hypothetical protein